MSGSAQKESGMLNNMYIEDALFKFYFTRERDIIEDFSFIS